MNSVYWRPQKASRRVLILISLAALGAWAVVHGSHLLGTAEYRSQKKYRHRAGPRSRSRQSKSHDSAVEIRSTQSWTRRAVGCWEKR